MWLGESLRYSEEDLMHLTLGFIGSYDPKYTSLSLYKKPGEVEEAAVVVGGEAGAGRTWRDWRGGERRGEAEDWEGRLEGRGWDRRGEWRSGLESGGGRGANDGKTGGEGAQPDQRLGERRGLGDGQRQGDRRGERRGQESGGGRRVEGAGERRWQESGGRSGLESGVRRGLESGGGRGANDGTTGGEGAQADRRLGDEGKENGWVEVRGGKKRGTEHRSDGKISGMMEKMELGMGEERRRRLGV